MKLYDFTINTLNGKSFDLGELKGKKVLLVNVASECGLTPQYTELVALREDYPEDKIAIVGVPCNDFGGQEPGSPDEIQSFCDTRFSVNFPLTEKIHVKGPQAHPLYKWLTEQTGTEVEWNFQKFLIDESGEVVRSVSPTVTPYDAQITDWLDGKSN